MDPSDGAFVEVDSPSRAAVAGRGGASGLASAVGSALVASVALGLAGGCEGPPQANPEEATVAAAAGLAVGAAELGDEARRDALALLLRAAVAGHDVTESSDSSPGVSFHESRAAFLNGHLRLRRWRFAGPAAGGSIPVELEFVPADDSLATAVERRRYVVAGRPGEWSIERADPPVPLP